MMSEFVDVDFAFVSDETLRRVLLQLQDDVKRSFEAESYLAALVACGACAEGVLTWALHFRCECAMESKHAQRNGSGAIAPLEEWNLSNLIATAKACGLLGDTAAAASWALKDFRNMIHPYRLLHQSARPDRSLALSSIGALKEICRSVSGRLASEP